MIDDLTNILIMSLIRRTNQTKLKIFNFVNQ